MLSKVTPITVTRAEFVAHNRWPDHDPGDEDESSWLSAPVAPSRSLVAVIERGARLAGALADGRMPFASRRPL